MAPLRDRILDLVADQTFPMSRDQLEDLAQEQGGGDPDLLLTVSTIADDRFASRDELAHRIDEALGVPDADVGVSMLEENTDWPR
jgi:hypothetical protein